MNKNNNTPKNTRGAAFRAQKRVADDAARGIAKHGDARSAATVLRNVANANTKLKITFLGGLEDVGEKNMAVIEYGNDAIVLDCGMSLGIDLPGVNYAINDTAYLTSIKHKLRAYVVTHGHLDHIGGLRHTVPVCPAPIYGSRYSIGVVQKSFEDELAYRDANFEPELVTVNIDNHERLKIGSFWVEFIRVTHSMPDPAAVCIETPVGRIIATGDFRLDPEPLDNLPSDTARLKELGRQGVLLLMSDSSYADEPGRVPTEHTLQDSFSDVIAGATGRIFVAVFSSNINRIQMIINAAVAAGRKVTLSGRSMLGYAEIAVKQGILKVPKGTIVPITQASTISPEQLLVLCTGGQGEPNAALQRMSAGEHTDVNLNSGDTVIISSSPIPGNEVSYDAISNRLKRKGVQLFRHPTYQIDGCGPLHVSGHARRDELSEMIRLVRPTFFVPVHAGTLRRYYHGELAVNEGVARSNVLLPENGDSLYLTNQTVEVGDTVAHGSLLIDQSGNVVAGIVVKDRLMLAEQGIVTVYLSIDKRSGRLLASPDIVARGAIAMRDNEALLNTLRAELRQLTSKRFKQLGVERFKAELRDHVTHWMFTKTQRSPMVIPVVSVIDIAYPEKQNSSPENSSNGSISAQQQQHFAQLRSRLLSEDRCG